MDEFFYAEKKKTAIDGFTEGMLLKNAPKSIHLSSDTHTHIAGNYMKRCEAVCGLIQLMHLSVMMERL